MKKKRFIIILSFWSQDCEALHEECVQNTKPYLRPDDRVVGFLDMDDVEVMHPATRELHVCLQRFVAQKFIKGVVTDPQHKITKYFCIIHWWKQIQVHLRVFVLQWVGVDPVDVIVAFLQISLSLFCKKFVSVGAVFF